MGALKDTYVQFTGGTIGFALWHPAERAQRLIERQAAHRQRAQAIEERRRAPASVDRPIIASPLRPQAATTAATTESAPSPPKSRRPASGDCGCSGPRKKKP